MYFITLCFSRRRKFGTNPHIAKWLIASLRERAADAEFFIHAYCVMPDHLHFLADGASDRSDLLAFVPAYKQTTAHFFSRRTRRELWQYNYYDHILRNADSPDSVAWYIWMNPVRKGICNIPRDYPFLGSFTEIGAKMLQGVRTPAWMPPWKRGRRVVAGVNMLG